LFVFRETETGYDDKAIPHFPSFSTAQESQVIKALPRKPTGNPPKSGFAARGDTDEYLLLLVDQGWMGLSEAQFGGLGPYLRHISGSRGWLCYRKSVGHSCRRGQIQGGVHPSFSPLLRSLLPLLLSFSYCFRQARLSRPSLWVSLCAHTRKSTVQTTTPAPKRAHKVRPIHAHR